MPFNLDRHLLTMNFYKWNRTPPSLDGVSIEPPEEAVLSLGSCFFGGMRWVKGQKGAVTALWGCLACVCAGECGDQREEVVHH